MSVYFYKRTGRWCISVQRSGTRVIRYAEKGATKKEALQYEARLIREIFLSEKLGRAKNRTVADAISRWIKEEVCYYKSKDKTISHILQLTDYNLERPLSQIHLLADEYATKNKQTISNGTINRRLSMLRLVANLCYKKWDWIDQPLGQKIKLLKEPDGRVPLISREEVDAILKFIVDEPCKTAIRIAAYCGLRAGEIQKLQPVHVKKDHLWLAFE